MNLKLSSRKKNRILYIIAIIAFLTYLFLMDPSIKGLYPSCPFYYLTGYYCPGCGTLRVLHNLMHGNILKALSYNALTVALLPLVLYLFLIEINIIKENSPLYHIFSKNFYSVLLVIIFVFWILRNIPFFPFSILAP